LLQRDRTIRVAETRRPPRSRGWIRIGLLLLASLPLACESKELPKPRNVILISLDTLRADHLGAWGYERDTSPRIDAFAERSVVFRRAVAQAHATLASHASLFTSLPPAAVLGRATGQGLSEWPDTLAEMLSRAGLATWGFVDGGNLRSYFGFARGFDHYEDRMVGVAQLVDRAQAMIESHPTQPFFLFLHCYDIHTPYDSPRPYVELFGDPDHTVETTHAYFTRVARGEVELGPRDLQEVVARYDAGIRYTDEQIGRFLDWLEPRGLLADSLVVITSDHGEEFLEHGGLGHHQLHLDPNLRVPLIFRIAGAKPRVIEETVELTDVVPTILDLLGLPPAEPSVGRSLAPVLAGGRAERGRLAYAEKGRKGVTTIVGDDHQLIHDEREGQARLFDLRSKPSVEMSLNDAPPARRNELESALTLRQKRTQELRGLARSTAARPRAIELDDDARRELEALGYLGDEEAVELTP
jgi:arylsulfatase A-like enzyme